MASLLVFGSGSKISQGLVAQLFKSKQFQTITCADLYPNYQVYENYFKLKDQLKAQNQDNKTELKDLKINERSDLEKAVSKNSHILYVSHDYYSAVSSKVNLLRTTAQLVKESRANKRLVAALPVEFDHQAEQDPLAAVARSENDAQHFYPEINLLKVDLTFGPHAGLLNQVIQRAASGQGLHFRPSSEKVSPIHSEDLAVLVQNLLSGKQTGKSYLARGTRQYNLNSLVETVQQSVGVQVGKDGSFLEGVVSPLSNGLLSETLYDDQYRHLVQFFNNYTSPYVNNASQLKELGLEKFKSVEETYKPKSVNVNDFIDHSSTSVRLGKSLFY